jgi:hypothetical protein
VNAACHPELVGILTGNKNGFDMLLSILLKQITKHFKIYYPYSIGETKDSQSRGGGLLYTGWKKEQGKGKR